MASKNPRRVVMRIDLSPKAKTAFTEIAARRGMTQVAVTSRIIEWLVRQPDTIQMSVLQTWHSDKDKSDQGAGLLTAVLKQIVAGDKSA